MEGAVNCADNMILMIFVVVTAKIADVGRGDDGEDC